MRQAGQDQSIASRCDHATPSAQCTPKPYFFPSAKRLTSSRPAGVGMAWPLPGSPWPAGLWLILIINFVFGARHIEEPPLEEDISLFGGREFAGAAGRARASLLTQAGWPRLAKAGFARRGWSWHARRGETPAIRQGTPRHASARPTRAHSAYPDPGPRPGCHAPCRWIGRGRVGCRLGALALRPRSRATSQLALPSPVGGILLRSFRYQSP